MLNPASGGASAGVWGRNPSAVKILMTESVSASLEYINAALEKAKYEIIEDDEPYYGEVPKESCRNN